MDRPYNFIEVEQDTPEWHEFRRGKIGSSSAAAIIGKSKFDTPLSLWEKIVFGKETKTNKAMQYGKTEEPKARKWFSEYREMEFKPAVLESKYNAKIIASLDGISTAKSLSDGSDMIVAGCEIKCPGTEDRLQALEGIIPEAYQWQMQHQMMVAGVNSWWYVSWDGQKGVPILLERDGKKIKTLIEEEEKFLLSIDALQAPDPTDKDWVDLCDEDYEQLALEFCEMNLKIKELEGRKDEVKAKVV